MVTFFSLIIVHFSGDGWVRFIIFYFETFPTTEKNLEKFKFLSPDFQKYLHISAVFANLHISAVFVYLHISAVGWVSEPESEHQLHKLHRVADWRRLRGEKCWSPCTEGDGNEDRGCRKPSRVLFVKCTLIQIWPHPDASRPLRPCFIIHFYLWLRLRCFWSFWSLKSIFKQISVVGIPTGGQLMIETQLSSVESKSLKLYSLLNSGALWL